MPRIHNALPACVVYLYESVHHATEEIKAGGSGFLLAAPVPDTDRSIIWAVSNRHVIEDAPVVRLNNQDGTFSVSNLTKDHWIPHPAGDDVAIAPMSIDPSTHKFTTVPREMLLSKDMMEELDIGIGDDVFVVGRFINHEGKARNTPSLRFGNIAQMPDTIQQESGFEQESFLVEAKSISGYSGSPVFVHILPMTVRPLPLNPGEWKIVPLPGSGPWLLGVDWGHIRTWEAIREASGEVVKPKQFSASNTGMMAVVPAWKLDELLESEPVKKRVEKTRAHLQQQ